MHLKSLVIKGFKSFADKTTLAFDPGLTVVVGPNGSGKSNVSDAILWVLGEQSARMLRGQVMQDVIFAGSRNRAALSVAEVTLVLDNTDHTLPLDFSEVALTRRMYRSGESEYLINGSPARLMDVQDILHDSGLGKDTHSIISQGKLDQILSSRPQERRALIEEAADISKHRRRKEKSEKKLASMEENLARAKVLARELSRQLKPLATQVDRAHKAHELEAEIRELTAALEVHRLRVLKDRSEHIVGAHKETEARLALAEHAFEGATAELEKLQQILEEKGLFVGDLSEQRRRLQELLGKLDADMRLLEEKGKNMVSRASDMRMQLLTFDKQQADARSDHRALEQEKTQLEVEVRTLKETESELQTETKRLARERHELEGKLAHLKGDVRSTQARHDKALLAWTKLDQQLKNADVEQELLCSRLTQAQEDLDQAQASKQLIAARITERSSAQSELAETQATQTVSCRQLEEELHEARRAHEEGIQELQSVRATYEALMELERQAQVGNDLIGALHECDLSEVQALKHCIEAQDEETERLLEVVWASRLQAWVLDESATQNLFASALDCQNVAGSIAAFVAHEKPAYQGKYDTLVHHIRVLDSADAYRSYLTALMSRVALVDELHDAFEALATTPELVAAVTRHAQVYTREGWVSYQSRSAADEGSLARLRRIRELERRISELIHITEGTQVAIESKETALAEGRALLQELSVQLVRLETEQKSDMSEVARLETQERRAQAEITTLEKKLAEARTQVESARLDIVSQEEQRSEAERILDELNREVAITDELLSQLISAQTTASRTYQQVKLDALTRSERLKHVQSRFADCETTLQSLAKKITATQQSASSLEVLRLRVDPLYERYETVLAAAIHWAERLQDQSRLAEADSESLKHTIGAAKQRVEETRIAVEHATHELSEMNVELAKIEVQVETVINRMLEAHIDIDHALLLPELDDSTRAEARLKELKEALSHIGPINEVAFDQYMTLKDRHDFISAQISDLESARSSLKKITSAIERKMRNRFLTVFEEVNQNFATIFSLLFPGGTAYLELTDPDNVFETGIEISAQPRGKKLTKMMLLSGGEKSLVALALLFATYKVRTVPFYVFDEVEAALDDANLTKLLDAIDELKKTTQLIVISHQRRTMEDADVLYGVSMQSDGVTQVVSQRLHRE